MFIFTHLGIDVDVCAGGGGGWYHIKQPEWRQLRLAGGGYLGGICVCVRSAFLHKYLEVESFHCSDASWT